MSGIVCPKCGTDEHVVMVEDGVWMCTHCVIEFNDGGRTNGGRIEAGLVYMIGDDSGDVDFISLDTPLPEKTGGFCGTIRVKISVEALESLDELYESLKRVKR